MVHASEGVGKPLAQTQHAETAIVCGIANAVFANKKVKGATLDWLALAADYNLIRDHIAATVPGFDNFNTRCDQPGGFYLGSAAAEMRFATPSGKAEFCAAPLPESLFPGLPGLKRRLCYKHYALMINITPPFMVSTIATGVSMVSEKFCSLTRKIWQHWH